MSDDKEKLDINVIVSVTPSSEQEPNPGGDIFNSVFADMDVEDIIRNIYTGTWNMLYSHLNFPPLELTPSSFSILPKYKKKLTFFVRPFEGVAYTTNSEEEAEIHFSGEYLCKIPSSRVLEEVMGVIFHEMTHVLQWNGEPNSPVPGALIEGIADYIRLKSNFIPPHWHLVLGGSWKDGYQRTAYFLNWIEQLHCPNFVAKLNSSFKIQGYEEKVFEKLTGFVLEDLWTGFQLYLQEQPKEKPTATESSPVIPTHPAIF